MAEVSDKGILVNWDEMRQSLRLRSARKATTANNVFNNVRVSYKKMQYCGKLEVSKNRIIVAHNDLEIDAYVFFGDQIRGWEPIIDDVKKVFQFRFNFKSEQRTPLIIYLKSRDMLKKLETAVSTLLGASIDFDPNEIVMKEADEPQDTPIN